MNICEPRVKFIWQRKPGATVPELSWVIDGQGGKGEPHSYNTVGGPCSFLDMTDA